MTQFRDRVAWAHFVIEFACGGAAYIYGGWGAALAVAVAVLTQCGWEAVRREREK